jgi:hypothetical protein
MSTAELLRAGHPHGSPWSSYERLAKPSTHWNDDDNLDQTHVSIRIDPAGPRGELRLRVALATPDWSHGESNQHSVQVGIILSYSDLGAFRRDFAALLDGKLREACLEAAPT